MFYYGSSGPIHSNDQAVRETSWHGWYGHLPYCHDFAAGQTFISGFVMVVAGLALFRRRGRLYSLARFPLTSIAACWFAGFHKLVARCRSAWRRSLSFTACVRHRRKSARSRPGADPKCRLRCNWRRYVHWFDHCISSSLTPDVWQSRSCCRCVMSFQLPIC